MRDPARISRILEKLQTVWTMDTDARCGQLMFNIFWQMPETKRVTITAEWGNDAILRTGVDPFFIEDEVVEAFLDRMIAEHTLVLSDNRKR